MCPLSTPKQATTNFVNPLSFDEVMTSNVKSLFSSFFSFELTTLRVANKYLLDIEGIFISIVSNQLSYCTHKQP